MHSLVRLSGDLLLWAPKKVGGALLDVTLDLIFGKEESFDYRSTTQPQPLHSGRPARMWEEHSSQNSLLFSDVGLYRHNP